MKKIKYQDLYFEKAMDYAKEDTKYKKGAYRITYGDCEVVEYVVNGVNYHPTEPAIYFGKDNFDYYNKNGVLHRLGGEARSMIKEGKIEKEYWIDGKQIKDAREYWMQMVKDGIVSRKEALLRVI